MKKLAIFFSLSACAAGGYAVYPYFLKTAFNLSGTVDISQRLDKFTQTPNTVCFVIVKNEGDMPVAVKRFVNPVFPLRFDVKKSDLLLADAWKDNLKIEVQVNNRGQVGTLRAGDMFGKTASPVRLFANNINVTVDKMLGMPSLAADTAYSEKFRHIFGSAAR